MYKPKRNIVLGIGGALAFMGAAAGPEIKGHRLTEISVPKGVSYEDEGAKKTSDGSYERRITVPLSEFGNVDCGSEDRPMEIDQDLRKGRESHPDGMSTVVCTSAGSAALHAEIVAG